MIQYMANRIISGALEYTYVIERRPDMKEGIDEYLIAHGRADLIVNPEVAVTK